MKVQVELDELLELQARAVELEEENNLSKGNVERQAKLIRSVDKLNIELCEEINDLKKDNDRLMRITTKSVTITDIKGNESKFPDHTMD